MPFAEPDRLVKVWETTPGYSRMELSAPNYRDWKAAARSYSSTGVYHGERVTLIRGGEPRLLRGTSVSADLFPTLGVSPILGRTFTADDDRPGAPATAILSYRLWQTEFGGDPFIVGRSVVLDDTPNTILGVMPRVFHFPRSDTLFWRTNRFDERAYLDGERTNNWLESVGRLRPGASLVQARAEMEAIAARSRREHPRANEDTGASVIPLHTEVSSGRGCCSSRSWARPAACCSSPAPTSPTCCSPAPWPDGASWPCGRPSGPGASGWSGSC